jgi:outer membrane lipoprotein-sorting protein
MRLQHLARKFAFAAPVFLLLLLPAQPGSAADKPASPRNLQQVLQQLDSAAKNFHTASADVKVEIVQTEPVPNTDTQTGTMYYRHQGNQVEMALHITQQNGQPFGQVLTYSKGVAQIYQQSTNQVTRYQNLAGFAPYLMLGFGATGQEMADKFNITYLGQESVNGVLTDKLQLIAKDPKILRMFPKITLWIDPVRDVNLKQVFDEGQGMSKTVTYSHIEVNHSIRSPDFTFKTNKNTQFSNQ